MNKFDPAAPFADLDSDLDAPASAPRKLDSEQQANLANYGHVASVATVAHFNCIKCGGSGRFIGYTGRDFGPCNRCGGRGTVKTDPMARQAAKLRKQQRELIDRQYKRDQFLVARPDVAAWFKRSMNTGPVANEFAESLWDALLKWGSLTPNQLAAIERSIERNKEYDAARAAKHEAIAADALDIRPIPSGLYLVNDVQLKVSNVANPASKWHGWVFVKRGPEEFRAGSQKPGQPYRGENRDELRAILKDGLAAAVAYGRKTGCCAICSRTLTDPESVARGIGPICAERFG
jgi:hypothetical protein